MATSASGPGDVLQASEGKTRFVRLARLLGSGGTTVMRELFDYIIPPANLAAVLSRTTVHLNYDQRQIVYPPLGAVQSSFDITLLLKLLRENDISGLSAPSRGWDKLPNIGDLSLPADMARIKYHRNCIAHHKTMELSEQEFSDDWKEIKDALMRIVGHYATSGSSTVTEWETAIDGLRTNPLNEDDRRNVEELSAEELKSYYLESRLETLLKVEKKEMLKSEKFQQAKSVLENLIAKIRLWLPIRESSMKLMRETADELDVIQREVDGKKFYASSVGVGGVVSLGVGAVACFFTGGLAAPFVLGGATAAVGGGAVSYNAHLNWLKENEIRLNRVKDVLENDCAEQQKVSREVQTLQDLTKQISQEQNISEEEALKNLLRMFNDSDNGTGSANLNIMLNLKKDLVDTINSAVVTLRAVAEISKIWSSLNDAEAREARMKDFLPILAAINVLQLVFSASSYLTGSKSQNARKLRETVNKLDEELHKHKDFLINFSF